jgi:lipoprotein-anchoring transpeptidase ErfK/SrfK
MASVTAVATDGRLTSLALASPDGPVEGTLTGATFTPSRPLALATAYTATATVQPPAGGPVVRTSTFTTTAPEATVSADITPEEGAVVGIGMPVIVTFSEDIPAEQQAAVAARLHVGSTPAVEGAWRWVNDWTVHWRPRTYWPANTHVTVFVDLAGRGIGNQWFETSAVRQYSIGESHRITIDLSSYQMVAMVNEQPVRQMAISGGRPAYPTAAGTNLIMEKYDVFEMDSTSVGITGAGAYDVIVDDAQRLTNSGTFLHAAPWNGQLGEANISHGCVNASNEDARWMMDFTQIGDPVEISNSTESVSFTNGWGDWNLSYEEWSAPA